MRRPKLHGYPSAVDKNENPYLSRWLQQLFDAGLRPKIEILEEVPKAEDLNEAEVFHITYWKSLGFKLTNLTEGGSQLFRPMEWTPEQRRAQSERLKGKPHPTMRGRKQTPEHLQKRSTKGVVRGPQSSTHILNNIAAHGAARPFTNGTKIFCVQTYAAKELGVSEWLVKEVLKGHKSKKLNLWYVDAKATEKDAG